MLLPFLHSTINNAVNNNLLPSVLLFIHCLSYKINKCETEYVLSDKLNRVMYEVTDKKMKFPLHQPTKKKEEKKAKI